MKLISSFAAASVLTLGLAAVSQVASATPLMTQAFSGSGGTSPLVLNVTGFDGYGFGLGSGRGCGFGQGGGTGYDGCFQYEEGNRSFFDLFRRQSPPRSYYDDRDRPRKGRYYRGRSGYPR